MVREVLECGNGAAAILQFHELASAGHGRYFLAMSITLNLDDDAVASLPLKPGERERHMQIELSCRYYVKGWLSFSQAARMAGLDHYAFGAELAQRDIPRQYGLTEALEDVAHARRK